MDFSKKRLWRRPWAGLLEVGEQQQRILMGKHNNLNITVWMDFNCNNTCNDNNVCYMDMVSPGKSFQQTFVNFPLFFLYLVPFFVKVLRPFLPCGPCQEELHPFHNYLFFSISCFFPPIIA